MIYRVPTHTSMVLDLLIGKDDFMSTKQIAKELDLLYGQALAAVIHLRNVKAVDCVIQTDGVPWWYATPESDQRMMIQRQRKDHITRNRTVGKWPRGKQRKKKETE